MDALKMKIMDEVDAVLGGDCPSGGELAIAERILAIPEIAEALERRAKPSSMYNGDGYNP